MSNIVDRFFWLILFVGIAGVILVVNHLPELLILGGIAVILRVIVDVRG